MAGLADAVLPLIRTRGELWRRSAANEQDARMHEAVDILETAATTNDPAEVYTVAQKALASAITVIARADDSSGIVGDACRRLLDLHPRAAAATAVPAGRLVDWMMKFQFDGQVDYFELDPVAYAPALGEKGLASYRSRLDSVRSNLGPEPVGEDRWSSPHRHEWFVLDWNAKRLAVLDRDVDAIIRTHARDRKVAAWFVDTAKALAEIGEIDLAIDWAGQAIDIGPWHQSVQAGNYWCELLADRQPSRLLDARLLLFRRWPSSSTGAAFPSPGTLRARSGSRTTGPGVTWPRRTRRSTPSRSCRSSLVSSTMSSKKPTPRTTATRPAAWPRCASLPPAPTRPATLTT